MFLPLSLLHPRPRGSQSGRGKMRDKSLKAWSKEPLGTNSHRTISKRSSEWWLLTGHKKCFVLLCPIGEQHLPSSFREFVHDGYYIATFARFVHQAFLIRNEGTTDESKNVWMRPAGAIQFALRNYVSDGSQCIVNNRMFKMQRRRESKKSNSLTRENNDFARAASRFFVHFFAVTARLPRENA